jgi:hypothetical protein
MIKIMMTDLVCSHHFWLSQVDNERRQAAGDNPSAFSPFAAKNAPTTAAEGLYQLSSPAALQTIFRAPYCNPVVKSWVWLSDKSLNYQG